MYAFISEAVIGMIPYSKMHIDNYDDKLLINRQRYILENLFRQWLGYTQVDRPKNYAFVEGEIQIGG